MRGQQWGSLTRHQLLIAKKWVGKDSRLAVGQSDEAPAPYREKTQQACSQHCVGQLYPCLTWAAATASHCCALWRWALTSAAAAGQSFPRAPGSTKKTRRTCGVRYGSWG